MASGLTGDRSEAAFMGRMPGSSVRRGTPKMKRQAITWFTALSLALSILASAIAIPSVSPPPVAAANTNLDQFANVNIPPDLGQAPFQVYFPQTEHTLRGYFL